MQDATNGSGDLNYTNLSQLIIMPFKNAMPHNSSTTVYIILVSKSIGLHFLKQNALA
jgi:hypothetical protein